jgi:hypothetical protein
MWSQNDLFQIYNKGISIQSLENQLDHFHKGFPFIRLLRPAIQNDGIMIFREEKMKELIALFQEQAPQLHVLKFVPASGAASRMFKHLFEFRESIRNIKIPENYASDTSFNSVYYFFQNIHHFAFYNDLQAQMEKEGSHVGEALAEQDLALLLDNLLGESGLNYAALPKALLAFHNYNDGPRTAMEEHLVEAASYARDKNNISRIHFTVSPEHIGIFDQKVAEVRIKYESRFQTHLKIHHSIQKSSTDTLAVDENNIPFRNPDGSLLFRPAGHGALIQNLDEQKADLIFIKNIDNIVPDRLKPATIEYKQLIGGFLLSIRQKIFAFLEKAESGHITSAEILEMAAFTASHNLLFLPADFHEIGSEAQCRFLTVELNRPIRVCGMVRNAGEPGGGPFWVASEEGKTSLQIVESSQVDMSDEGQRLIFLTSTHFNPVDIVCSTIDYKGIPFNLQNFVDESTGFISLKSSGGRILKAQELPGLWNGAMAGWITLFVETPLITFNPVKTINDLLREEHQ